MKPTILTLAFFLCALSLLHAQNPPKGFEKVDQEIVITAVRTQMKYDVPAFNVKPESRVKLTFKNPDDLPHNLIICTPGKSKGKDKGGELIEAVLELGAKGEEMNWEPKGHPRILHSSGMVQPKKESVIWFKAPKEEGAYPYVCTFPGHGLLMYGAMYVGVPMPPLEKDGNVPEAARQGKTEARQFHAWGEKRPLMYRIFMPEASPAAIAVALKHGQNYCWDAGQCRLRYAWYGGFVDPWPVWRGNGHGLAKVLGTKYWESDVPGSIKIGDSEAEPKFLGYRKVDGQPEFHYRVNGVDVYELITPLHSVIGIQRSFRIPNNTKPVVLPVGPTGRVAFEHSAGKLKDGLLVLTAGESASFTVSIGLIK